LVAPLITPHLTAQLRGSLRRDNVCTLPPHLFSCHLFHPAACALFPASLWCSYRHPVALSYGADSSPDDMPVPPMYPWPPCSSHSVGVYVIIFPTNQTPELLGLYTVINHFWIPKLNKRRPSHRAAFSSGTRVRAESVLMTRPMKH